MCAPTFYGVDYVINPWMEGQLGKANLTLAQQQWESLHKELSARVKIALVEPVKGVPDLVFTANAGLVRGTKVVVSRFRSVERQGEEPVFREWFAKNGFEVIDWPRDVHFEGAGDALFDRGAATDDILWMGYGFRSDLAAAALLETHFGKKVVPLKLVDPRFYHLDTCMCPLTGGYLMYYPPAFDADAQRTIEELVPANKRIIVPDADAALFACNTVDLAPVLVMNDASSALQDMLAKAGFQTVLTPLSEFLRAGGTAKCLTLKLREA